MNVWRWLGLSVFVIGAACLLGAANSPIHSVLAQDKTKTDGKTKTEVKKEDKTKTDTKKEDKTEVKKEDKQPAAQGALKFTAFDAKAPAFYQEQYTKTIQKLKVMGQDVTQEQEQTFLIKWTPKEEKGGDWVVEQKIDGVEMKITIGGTTITYNSKLGDEKQLKNPMTEFFGTLRKNPLVFTIKKDLTISKIDEREKFIKDLGVINPQMTSLLNAILSDKALTKMAEPTWYAYPPGGSIPSGNKWDKTSELDLGPVGKYKTEFKFTYDKLEKEKDSIKIETTLDYTAPTDKAGLPFIIHEAKLTEKSGTGTAVFDRTKGRFESTSIEMKLKGTLKIEVSNTQTTVEIDQTQTARSTTYSDKPAAWGK